MYVQFNNYGSYGSYQEGYIHQEMHVRKMLIGFMMRINRIKAEKGEEIRKCCERCCNCVHDGGTYLHCFNLIFEYLAVLRHGAKHCLGGLAGV